MRLSEKIGRSQEIISKALNDFSTDEVALAWTGGKDSTVLLHLIRRMYQGKIPVRVYFNDSGVEFGEVEEFIEKIRTQWSLNLIRHKHIRKDRETIRKSLDPAVARQAKIRSIKRAVKKYQIRAFLTGIRKDEHQARSKEAFLVKYSNHVRYHPILHFTEKDVWEYIRKHSVLYVSLYDQGYRSLGEKPFTKPTAKGSPERAGRDQDKEKVMARLRKLGYW